jgi:predicted nucleic acid-binding Zn ribbon protein
MNESLKCEIIKDLLPSYIDGLTSEITNVEIQKHLDHCEACSSLLNKLQKPEPLYESCTEEINYLKKVKQRARIKIVFSILIAAILIISVFTWRIFILGFSASPSSVHYSVSVDGNTVTLSGTLLGSEGYSHVNFMEEDGVISATVYVTPVKFFWHTDHFAESYTANAMIKAVYFDDLIAYDNGEISKNVAEIFKTRTAYLGDISADNRIANALSISSKIGAYTNELHTSSLPFGWILHLNNDISSSEEILMNEKMTSYSYILIALIDNLGYVSWEYETDTGSKTLTITENEASTWAGANIKSYSESASALQSLMKNLGMA